MSNAKTEFEKVYEEIRASLKPDKDGQLSGSFKKSDYLNLAKAMLNTPDYSTEIVKSRNDEDGTVVTETLKPVEMFREKFLKPILKDCGVDAAEADMVMTMEIKKVEGLYELVKELDYQYMMAGRNVDFLPKEDFKASMSIDHHDEFVRESRVPGKKDIDGNDVFVKNLIKEHFTLGVNSKVPSNKKKRI